MKAKTVKEVLIATKYILEKLEWHQGSFFKNSKGVVIARFEKRAEATSVCLLGALYLADEEHPNHAWGGPLHQMAENLITSEDDVWGGIAGFNDRKGQTKKKVIKLLSKVIAKIPT